MEQIQFVPKDFELVLPRLIRFVKSLPQENNFVLEIKEEKKLRSLTANAYLWVLCEKLAAERSKEDALTTKEEIYIDAIREAGMYRDFHIRQKEAPTFCTMWHAFGTGWPTEQVDYTPEGLVVIRAYYGSSVYSAKRMARLIDNLVQDCKAVGIETLPPDKLAALVGQHQPVKIGGGDG